MARILLFVLAAVLCTVIAERLEKEVSGIKFLALKRAGKIFVFPANKNNGSGVILDFDSVAEYNAAGQLVDGGRRNFQNFEKLDFKFYGDRDATFQNISCRTFSMEAKIPSTNATFRVQLFIFKENGTYEWGDEAIDVTRGALKFNIEVEDWKFCGSGNLTCRRSGQNEVGEYLEVVICIKGRKSPTMGAERPRKMRMGRILKMAQRWNMGGTYLELPSAVEIDGVMKNQTSGYPRMTRARAGCFVMRFPKFNRKMIYDPAIEVDPTYEDPDSGSRPLQVSLVLACVSLLAAWLH
ncbi:predicted protein [Nematostella vectensis]|uniref:Uncharacterized protein n=1 Tax=Nematostella vectensis TaxID=45351 RepID=A7RRP3_NEMVE|nr:skeletal aspartic acid-rich protein 2 [Nematostella vectensis]EDO45862.1 predicted protein [Nematostella vectensis]|eukprot:XP_001637925.1 predicted protein [Nematostella vectensis]